MLMVIFDARTGARTGALANRVGVIEPKQTLVRVIVQRQRIVESVRFLRCRQHSSHPELDPIAALDAEALAVEQEEGVEAGVSFQLNVITK